jgi:hypothetical protein
MIDLLHSGKTQRALELACRQLTGFGLVDDHNGDFAYLRALTLPAIGDNLLGEVQLRRIQKRVLVERKLNAAKEEQPTRSGGRKGKNKSRQGHPNAPPPAHAQSHHQQGQRAFNKPPHSK